LLSVSLNMFMRKTLKKTLFPVKQTVMTAVISEVEKDFTAVYFFKSTFPIFFTT
jgi:hypothetical protein